MCCPATRLVILSLLLLGIPGSSHLVARQKAVTASGAWVKAPGAGETTAAAFVEVDNPTMYDVYLVSGTTDAAARVQFRETTEPGGSHAKTVPELTVPAFGVLEMKPDGVHVLLTDLKRPLKAGDTISLTLTTDSGVALEVSAVVRDK